MRISSLPKQFLALLHSYLFPPSEEEKAFWNRITRISPPFIWNRNPDGVRYLFPYQSQEGKGAIYLVKTVGDAKALDRIARLIITDFLTIEARSRRAFAVVPSESLHTREAGHDHAAGLQSASSAFITSQKLDIAIIPMNSRGKKKRQTDTSSRTEREANVRDTMECGISVRDMTVCLVDDVCTTGSTLREATRALKKQGARLVIPYVVARES